MSSGWPTADQVFILRFWKEEAEDDQQTQWRVQVQNVNTRRRQVVDDIDRAFAIVMDRLKAVGEDSVAGPKGVQLEIRMKHRVVTVYSRHPGIGDQRRGTVGRSGDAIGK